MKKLKLDELGLVPMLAVEILETDGGEVITNDPVAYGYRVRTGLNSDLQKAKYIAHQVSDFCRGFWNAIVN